MNVSAKQSPRPYSPPSKGKVNAKGKTGGEVQWCLLLLIWVTQMFMKLWGIDFTLALSVKSLSTPICFPLALSIA